MSLSVEVLRYCQVLSLEKYIDRKWFCNNKDIPPNSIVYNSLKTTIKKNDKTLRSK